MQFIKTTLVKNKVTFQTLSSQMSSWKLHRHQYPNFADSLSLTNRMSVLPSPPQEAEMIISRCFSNVFRIKSCSCFLIKAHSLPGTTGEITYRGAAALLGTAPARRVTVFCTEMGEFFWMPLGAVWLQQTPTQHCLCTTFTSTLV